MSKQLSFICEAACTCKYKLTCTFDIGSSLTVSTDKEILKLEHLFQIYVYYLE